MNNITNDEDKSEFISYIRGLSSNQYTTVQNTFKMYNNDFIANDNGIVKGDNNYDNIINDKDYNKFVENAKKNIINDFGEMKRLIKFNKNEEPKYIDPKHDNTYKEVHIYSDNELRRFMQQNTDWETLFPDHTMDLRNGLDSKNYYNEKNADNKYQKKMFKSEGDKTILHNLVINDFKIEVLN